MSRQGDRSPSGTEIAIGLRRGEEASIRLVKKRIRRILSFRALHIPESVVEDLEQNVLVETWQAVNRSRFEPTGGFWAFLELITTRRAIDWLRSRPKTDELPGELQDPAEGPLSASLSKERTKLAFEVLAHLEPPCCRLIYLHLGLGLTYREIGKLLSKNEGALRVQMFRCIRAARSILAESKKLSATPSTARGDRT